MNISLVLTCLRLFLSPLLLAPLITWHAPIFFIFSCYCLLAATDFLDGFFARRFKQTTPLGAFLDQFADKIFLFSVMFATVYTWQCTWWMALALAIRELFVMGLREYGMQKNISLPVIYSAKIKTTLQIIFFGWLLIKDSLYFTPYMSYSDCRIFDCLSYLSLCTVTLGVSYYSAYWYFKKVMGVNEVSRSR